MNNGSTKILDLPNELEVSSFLHLWRRLRSSSYTGSREINKYRYIACRVKLNLACPRIGSFTVT